MRSIHLPKATHAYIILPGRIAGRYWKTLATTCPKRLRKTLPTGS